MSGYYLFLFILFFHGNSFKLFRNDHFKQRSCILSLTKTMEKILDEDETKYRFWTRKLIFRGSNGDGSNDDGGENAYRDDIDNNHLSMNIDNLPQILRELITRDGLEMNRLEMGLALVPSLGFAVPIHDGIIQQQHIVRYVADDHSSYKNHSRKDVLLFGFSPRAKHVIVAPSEEERQVDHERLEALLIALKQYANITRDELMSEELAGTSPARIFRSFVAPRPKATFILEPIGRAANRTAAQIDMTLRQVRADQAAYLRNNDKSITSLSSSASRTFHPIVLVLDNIRSAFNVGSMFRTAETAGVAELITCGITAHPPHPKLRKTAFTSIDVVPHRHFDDILVCIQTLKSQGYSIIAMETTSKSQIYTDVIYPTKNVALILGNEVTGVDTRVMDLADMIVEIPTYGIKNSLNVASAAPVVLFEVLRQWHPHKKQQY